MTALRKGAGVGKPCFSLNPRPHAFAFQKCTSFAMIVRAVAVDRGGYAGPEVQTFNVRGKLETAMAAQIHQPWPQQLLPQPRALQLHARHLEMIRKRPLPGLCLLPAKSGRLMRQ